LRCIVSQRSKCALQKFQKDGFCGAVIFTFGLMLEHLEAIRRNSTEQSEMLTELLRRTPQTDSSRRESMAQSLDQLTKSNFRFKDI